MKSRALLPNTLSIYEAGNNVLEHEKKKERFNKTTDGENSNVCFSGSTLTSLRILYNPSFHPFSTSKLKCHISFSSSATFVFVSHRFAAVRVLLAATLIFE